VILYRCRVGLRFACASAWSLVAVAGCGRIDFDPLAGPGDAMTDGAAGCTFGPFGGITRLTAANTDLTEYAPSLSADGLTLYYASNRTVGGMGGFDIWKITRASVGAAWSAASNVSSVNSALDEYGPAITRDDRTLYFAASNNGELDIFSASRATPGGAFGARTLVTGVNSTSIDDTPSPTADGLSLVFRSERPPGGPNASEVYLATRPAPTGPFTAVRRLTEINSTASDQGAAITADGLTVTFGSTRGIGGDYDLYLATRPDQSSMFSPPTRIDELATTAYDDDAMISDDLRTIYFVSDRPGTQGSTDIWFATRACQ
jgi:hypothetical protein